GFEEGFVHVEITALEPIGRAQRGTPAARLARPHLPLDEDDVLPGGRPFPGWSRELEGAVVRDHAHGGLVVEGVGGALAVEVDGRADGRLTLVEHLAVHGIEAARVPAAGSQDGQGRGGERGQNVLAHGNSSLQQETRGRGLGPRRGPRTRTHVRAGDGRAVRLRTSGEARSRDGRQPIGGQGARMVSKAEAWRSPIWDLTSRT